MSTVITKTLQATLAPPTAHKESKLNDLLDVFRDALREAFDSCARTMSLTADIVRAPESNASLRASRKTSRKSLSVYSLSAVGCARVPGTRFALTVGTPANPPVAFVS